MIKRIISNGILNTTQGAIAAVEDWVFDARHGLDTRQEVAVQDLDIGHEHKQYAEKYKATRARYFRKLIQHVDLPRDGVFVDVGCGKGRILLLAIESGFDRVLGLEISPNLCEIAKRNIAAFRKRGGTNGSVSVACTNILDHQLSHDETVFFLYSPFERDVTRQFLDMVRESIEQNPRELFLVIDEFRFPDLLASCRYFNHVLTYQYGSAVFDVYKHQVS